MQNMQNMQNRNSTPLTLLRNMTTKLITHIEGVTETPISQENCERCINLGGIKLRTGNLPLESVLSQQFSVNIGVYTPSRNGGLLLKAEGLTEEAPSAYLIGFVGAWRLAAHDLNNAPMSDVQARLAQSVIVIGRNKTQGELGVTVLMKEGACMIATRTNSDSPYNSFVLRAANGVVEHVQ